MLDEVRQTELFLVLEHRARLDHQSKLGPLPGFTVLAYVVLQPVGQPTHDDGRIDGQRLVEVDGRLLGPGYLLAAGQHNKDGKENLRKPSHQFQLLWRPSVTNRHGRSGMLIG